MLGVQSDEGAQDDENRFFEWGTQITISNIHRKWTKEMIKKIKEFIATMQSPFSSLERFDVQVKVDDSHIDANVKETKMEDIFSTANYTFTASITKTGAAVMNYSYNSENHPEFKRSEKFERDLKPYAKGITFKREATLNAVHLVLKYIAGIWI